MSKLLEQERKKFEIWHRRSAGFSASSRGSEPGYTNMYLHPFTQGAWVLWQDIYINSIGETNG